MKIPNLFIVGAPKAGTSFLYQQLKVHPELFFSKVKELNHFSDQEISESGSYYKDFRVSTLDSYLKFYKSANGERYLTDCSVSYFAYPEVAKKIYAFNDQAKVVIILRNPIKRAYSHYLMDKRMGYTQKPFNKYLSNENDPHYHSYVHNSLYHRNVKNYMDIFGRDQVCVLFLEDIELTINKLFDFLGVEGQLVDTSSKVNQNKKPRNVVSRYLQKNRDITSKLKLFIPEQVIRNLNRLLYKKAETERISHGDQQLLYNLLKSDIDALESLVNVNVKELWSF